MDICSQILGWFNQIDGPLRVAGVYHRQNQLPVPPAEKQLKNHFLSAIEVFDSVEQIEMNACRL